MTKILGWPEPSEVGGHRVKRQSTHLNRSKDTFKCVDCGLQELGGVTIFSVGVDGCPERPESLNYLSLVRFEDRESKPTTHEAREHWLEFAKRVGLKIDDLHYIDDSPTLCAAFFFNGQAYHLRYNQGGGNHIHAVKIEE